MIALKVGVDRQTSFEPLDEPESYLFFTDLQDLDPRYTGYVYQDELDLNNIPRAFGSAKQLKPKQAVKRHEAATTLAKFYIFTAEEAIANLPQE